MRQLPQRLRGIHLFQRKHKTYTIGKDKSAKLLLLLDVFRESQRHPHFHHVAPQAQPMPASQLPRQSVVLPSCVTSVTGAAP